MQMTSDDRIRAFGMGVNLDLSDTAVRELHSRIRILSEDLTRAGVAEARLRRSVARWRKIAILAGGACMVAVIAIEVLIAGRL